MSQIKRGERLPSMQLEGFGFFGGCDYCIDELEAAIEMSEDGFELTGAGPNTLTPAFRYGTP